MTANGNTPINIDKLINSEYDASVPSFALPAKPITVQFRLYKNRPDDVAIEKVLDNWAEANEKTKNLKLAVGMFHAAERKDITWFENNMGWLVADLQLAGHIDMQQQIDRQQQQIEALLARQNEHGHIIKQMLIPVEWLSKKIGQLQIIKPNTKEKLADGN